MAERRMNEKPMSEMYPLSPMQQGMLFHSLSAPTGVDVEQIFCALRENLNAAAFERAWRRVVERHAILRTSFHWQGLTEPRQQTHPRVEMEFSQEDWRERSETERRALFEERLASERRRGFDLTRAPLMRLALFHRKQNEWQFLWTFHHLLLDGRAIVVLLNEVFAFYEAFARNEDLELPAPRNYRDFIEWLQKQDWSRAEMFWREALKDFTTATPLTVMRAANEEIERDNVHGEQQIGLSETTTAALKSFAQTNRFTLNTLVQGAWALLLSRYSGEEDVVFGAVRAGRHSTVEGAESIVGLCINSVPLRVRVPANAELLPWLGRLRNAWVALREFEHTPLVKIQGWSDVPRGRPLFESIFNFQDPSWDAALRAQDGKWAKREFGIRSQLNYPLAVDAYGGRALLIKILYHRIHFDDDAITRMLGHFKALLEGMAANPKTKLFELPLLTQAERKQILIEWNDTRADFPKDKCVHELFAEQAARTPDALAVADEKKCLNYGELNARADLLAAKLRELGVGPDVCVGVCLERSVEMVVCKLAIWKAGAAYVPLDPAYPQERLKFMLEDAKMPVLLLQGSRRDNLKFEIPNLKVLCVDDICALRKNSKHPTFNIQHQTSNSRSLAYVIYTSGSTGEPKGVEIEHASLMNLIAWHQRIYKIIPKDRAAQTATPAFDAAVWELWPYLTCGASIHIPAEDTRLSPKKLARWLAANKITLAFVPTPIAEAMLDEDWPEDCVLRALLTGGDKLRRAPGENLPCALVNHYGPTENTVVTTSCPVPPAETNVEPPPIGRPIANTQVFILDKNLQPVPVGVPGELHIGGPGLARGYRNRPELTAEKFVPYSFEKNPNARLYKTGDLVRWLPDGQIEFLGRLDYQVKVRGQRIELGEIEAALGRHPGVGEAIVIPRENAKGENRLAAYVVSKDNGKLTSEALREFLKQKLPDAMIPSAFTFLDALPLTPNGKVDRRALPAPDFKMESELPFVAPRTPTETQLAEIWRDVLDVERAGIHDNFFELGGHSLTATQVISRLPGAFQIELPLHDLFDSPTIAELAEKIDAARQAVSSSVSSQALFERNGNLPLSFAQERLWFMEQLEPGQPFNNIPVVLRLEGALNVGALEKSVSEIVRRHKTLRTIFNAGGGQPAAIVAPATEIKIPVVDLSPLPDAEREQQARELMLETARQPFELSRNPPLRVKLLRLNHQTHLLLFTTHHIACDGWSLGIFYRELTALYEAFSQGHPSPLAELPADYAGFARSQRGRLQGKVLENQLAFWKRQLDGAQTMLDLPTDRPRPAIQPYRGAIKHFVFPKKLAADLARTSREENVTLFMLLLAAIQTLLHRYTGQEDILIGSPIAGRTQIEVEKLVGLFLNTLVLRGDLSGDPPFRELLKRVRKTALDAYAHQELPFGKLVDALQPARDLSRSPLFQIMFILQNEPLRPLELAGLKLAPVPVHSGTAKFDLTFSLEETGDGFGGFVEYNTDLFDESTIARLLGNYQTLLEGVAANPGQCLSQLPLLTKSEQKQILETWNDTGAEFPVDKCVHQLFEEQAKRTPDAVALVFEEEELTYHALNERANVVAAKLRELGVGPDRRVAICVKRSLDMVAGLLGILKAGGCYVPLDPTYPQERLEFMLEDSGATVLLAQQSLRDNLKFEISDLKLLYLDALPDETGDRPNGSIPQPATRDPRSGNLAYVIYTSGSTGKPKGVMVTHRNVVNFFTGMNRVLGTKPGVWLAVTSISFDISVLELFWTLAHGFKVVIQPGSEWTNGQGRSVPEQIVWHDVTHLQCTPSLAGMLVLASASHQAVRRLDKLLLGGEALPVSLAKQLHEILHGELINLYGPTETTVWSAVHHVDKTENSIFIGRPIANTQIYILDKQLQPVPPGVPGEIFIGGEGVARGYLNQPELTAEKFMRHPFRADENARIYRTGDLGHFCADGTIEFLGRLDHQVKIRGHRIELGEIESALGGHATVRECVVAAREDTPGDKRLIAYVVAPNAKPEASELRRFLQSKLPEAMIPSAFVFLDKLPLTPNGKINRKALPAPENQRPELETAFVSPHNELEKSIAGIWRELLRVQKVGLRDNFFDLGGNSLLVVQAQARLRETLGFDLPVVKLFQYPTVGALADFLSEREPTHSEQTFERGRKKQAAIRRKQKKEEMVPA
jgi:amino acid adenylation domain-containing protein